MIQPFIDTAVPLLFAGLFGAMLGLEREVRGRWAGLRTHIMVSVGSAVFMLAGLSGGQHVEIGRVIQGVAAGIGFIGAGTIIKLTDRIEVKGLTTASSIWVASAIGIATGLRQYLLALIGAAIAVVVLTVLQRLEEPIKDIAKTDDERNTEKQ